MASKKIPKCKNCYRLGHTYTKCTKLKLPTAVYKSAPAEPTLLLVSGDTVVDWDCVTHNLFVFQNLQSHSWLAHARETTKSSKLKTEVCELAAVPMKVCSRAILS